MKRSPAKNLICSIYSTSFALLWNLKVHLNLQFTKLSLRRLDDWPTLPKERAKMVYQRVDNWSHLKLNKSCLRCYQWLSQNKKMFLTTLVLQKFWTIRYLLTLRCCSKSFQTIFEHFHLQTADKDARWCFDFFMQILHVLLLFDLKMI